VHHPIYSAYGSKPGSQHLKSVLQNAVKTAARTPTGSVNPKPLPTIVAGAGGYNLRLYGLSKAFHTAKLPVKMVLESFTDSQHGYLRIRISKESIACEYVAVPDPSTPKSGPLKAFDSLTINTKH
jgi:hypothetical protein